MPTSDFRPQIPDLYVVSPRSEVRRPLLNFRHQIGLLYIRQVNLQPLLTITAKLLACRAHVEGQTALLKALQPSLKKAISIYRISRRQLHPAPGKAFVIRRANQLSIQPRRGNLQRVRTARNRVLKCHVTSNLQYALGGETG